MDPIDQFGEVAKQEFNTSVSSAFYVAKNKITHKSITPSHVTKTKGQNCNQFHNVSISDNLAC